MDTSILKERILKAVLDSQDENLLGAMLRIIKAHEKDPIIGADQEMNLITRSILRDQIKDASQRVKEGDFIDHNDLEKRVTEW